MCIVIHKPQGISLKKEIYLSCFENNPDGAGFLIHNNGELVLEKGFFKFEDFWKQFSPHQNKRAVIHFRIRTHGKKDIENTHPFWIAENELAFAHNGIIGETIGNDSDKSDTLNFNTTILQKLYKQFGSQFIHNEVLRKLLVGYVGWGNKIVFMDKEGTSYIFNRSQGEEKHGAWFSNDSYKKKWYFIDKDEKKFHYKKGEKWDDKTATWIPNPKKERDYPVIYEGYKGNSDLVKTTIPNCYFDKARGIYVTGEVISLEQKRKEKEEGWQGFFKSKEQEHDKTCKCRKCRVDKGIVSGKPMVAKDPIKLIVNYHEFLANTHGEVVSFNQNGSVNCLFYTITKSKYKPDVPVEYLDQVTGFYYPDEEGEAN